MPFNAEGGFNQEGAGVGIMLTPSVINSLSISLSPTIAFTTALVLTPQAVDSAAISLDPLIEFKSAVNLTPNTLNTTSAPLNPVITTGAVQVIGTVTAGFANDKYTVKFKE